MSKEMTIAEPLVIKIEDPFGRSVAYHVRIQWIQYESEIYLSMGMMTAPKWIKPLFFALDIRYPKRVIGEIQAVLIAATQEWGAWTSDNGFSSKILGMVLGLRQMKKLFRKEWYDHQNDKVVDQIWGAKNSVTREPLLYWGSTFILTVLSPSGELYLNKSDVHQLISYFSKNI